MRSMKSHMFADVAYIDMAKAFDKVSHTKLLHKIYNLGICGNVYSWFESYLKNRLQRVKVNDQYSDFTNVTSGVPQGSVIGHLLFLIYINDLPTIFKPQIITSDDAKISIIYKSIDDRKVLQSGLFELSLWMCKWDLELAIQKCSIMTFGNINTHSYTINNIQLNSLTEFKDLGRIFNTKLTFDTHINQMCSKAFNILNIIFRCFIINDYCYLTKAFITYFRPLLEYNYCIWNPSNIYVGLKNKIEKVQRTFTKRPFYRCGIPYTNYEHRLLFLNLTSLSQRRLRADLILAYKIINGLVDVVCSGLLETYSSRSRGPSIKVRKDKCKTNVTLNYFSNRISTPWNLLSNYTCSATSVNQFITRLDNSLY